jgi:hypothetical protein
VKTSKVRPKSRPKRERRTNKVDSPFETNSESLANLKRGKLFSVTRMINCSVVKTFEVEKGVKE